MGQLKLRGATTFMKNVPIYAFTASRRRRAPPTERRDVPEDPFDRRPATPASVTIVAAETTKSRCCFAMRPTITSSEGGQISRASVGVLATARLPLLLQLRKASPSFRYGT